MIDDVRREGAGEFKDSKEGVRAISTRTAKMYKEWLENEMRKEVA
jgi:hypothetical protein